MNFPVVSLITWSPKKYGSLHCFVWKFGSFGLNWIGLILFYFFCFVVKNKKFIFQIYEESFPSHVVYTIEIRKIEKILE